MSHSTETVDLEWFADNTVYVLNYWEAAVTSTECVVGQNIQDFTRFCK